MPSGVTDIRTRGLTLIELMAVIGIIGILASIVTVSLTVIRERSARAMTLSALENARTGAVTCILRGASLVVPVVRQPICAGSIVRWPQLGNGWSYSASIASDVSLRTFSFSATRSSCTVTCIASQACSETCS